MTTEHAQDEARGHDPAAAAQTLLARMRRAHRAAPFSDAETRRRHLERLADVLLARREALADAVSADFGSRSRHETLLAEVWVTVNGIRHARAHVARWMEPQRREVPWAFQPARAELVPQPLGVVGIISPWNYPVQLALAPLTGALAAGDRAMIKPSEHTPATSELLRAMISECFAEDHVAVLPGDARFAEAFSSLPFDHLIFTGSTRVGRKVMRAAAENLTPVTLELGGKSPVIVGRDVEPRAAAAKVMLGKLVNAGQTCVAPDYALVPRARLDAFVAGARESVAAMYPTLRSNPDYTSLISAGHRDRLRAWLEDARAKGAELVELNPASESLEGTNKLAPTLVLGATDEMTVLQEELFGPVLPVLPYDSLDEAIDHVNDRPRPLALYYFGHDPGDVSRVLDETVSGGVCVNETLLHVGVDDLPFGGVGPSGVGHYHGREGFEALSKMKPVFHQARVNGSALLRPPFGAVAQGLLRLLLGR
ncbi:MAG: coniferyl aldehyde dehydrogenase [Polyangiales bacterium]